MGVGCKPVCGPHKPLFLEGPTFKNCKESAG